MIFSDELLFSLFLTTGRVFVLRKPKETFQTAVKNGGGSVMTWDAFSWKFGGPMIFNVFQRETPFSSDNAQIHTARIVKE